MTNEKAQMTIEIPKQNEQKYDLEERTLVFAKNCIKLAKSTVKDSINNELLKQLIRSSSSIGANYREANDAITIKIFNHQINICRTESKESKYWLELLMHTNEEDACTIKLLIEEALQLTRIFASINNKIKIGLSSRFDI